MDNQIYKFGFGKASGADLGKDKLGGKGYGLQQMSKLGLPVPAGFTFPCSWCVEYRSLDSAGREALVETATSVALEAYTALSQRLGYSPLVSVRSGARVSMPGMMDTVLNVGLTGGNYYSLAGRYGQATVENCRERLSVMSKDVIGFDIADKSLGEQLASCIRAVWESWDNPRAIEYRQMHGYPDDWGTAVTVQMMVFGNAGEDSCTGVLFTRNPMTGENTITGEYLINAQGEDVVAGTATPDNIASMKAWNESVYGALAAVSNQLEAHYKHPQDIEFTVERGNLYILQTRNAKRSARAGFRWAHDMVAEKVITKRQVRENRMVTVADVIALDTYTISNVDELEEIGSGIAAGGSVVTGRVALGSSAAVDASNQDAVIMVADETTPDDIAGMSKSVGILTATGGLTSHAAVVARGMNKTCVVGAGDVAKGLQDGDEITIDGSSGKVYKGRAKLIKSGIDNYAREVLKFYNRVRYTPIVWHEALGITDVQVVDTRRFESSDSFDVNGAAETVNALAAEVRTVIVDLRSVEFDYTDDDQNLLAITGDNIESRRERKRSAKSDLINKITAENILYIDSFGIAAAANKPTIKKLEGVQDYLTGNAVYGTKKDLIPQLGSKAAVKEFFRMVAESGRKYYAYYDPIDFYDYVTRYFG